MWAKFKSLVTPIGFKDFKKSYQENGCLTIEDMRECIAEPDYYDGVCNTVFKKNKSAGIYVGKDEKTFISSYGWAADSIGTDISVDGDVFLTFVNEPDVLYNKTCPVVDTIDVVEFKNDDKQRVVKKDNVNHPTHYQTKNGLEAIDVIKAFTEDLYGMDAVYTGQVLRYMCRWSKKNGLEDLKKAEWYLNELIKTFKET